MIFTLTTTSAWNPDLEEKEREGEGKGFTGPMYNCFLHA